MGLAVLGSNLESPWVVVALAIVAAVAERISVGYAVAERGLTRTEEQSISIVPTLFAAVLFGPLAGGRGRRGIDARGPGAPLAARP